MSFKTLAAATFMALTSAAMPAMAQMTIRPLLGFTLTGGGEKLATVTYTDGSTQSIRSGGLVHVFGGVEFQTMDTLAIQLNVGYHADDTNARNGSVKFSRVPVEGLLLWNAGESIRLGIGARKATGTKLSSSGAATLPIGNQSVESKAGVILQGEYVFANRYSVLLRYVNESYTFAGGAKVSGHHGGLGMSVRF